MFYTDLFVTDCFINKQINNINDFAYIVLLNFHLKYITLCVYTCHTVCINHGVVFVNNLCLVITIYSVDPRFMLRDSYLLYCFAHEK